MAAFEVPATDKAAGRICKNCIHAHHVGADFRTPRCTALEAEMRAGPPTVNVITGEQPDTVELPSCEEMRCGRCGVAGRLYEARESGVAA